MHFLTHLYAPDGAEGSAAAEGASNESGVTSGAADRYTQLKAAGVPESKLGRYKDAKGSPSKSEAPSGQTTPADGGKTETSADSAKASSETAEVQSPQRMTWDQIKSDPEYGEAYRKEMSSAIQNRLRNAKSSEETLNKLSGAISLIAGEYGMSVDDISNLDVDAFVKAVRSDDRYYEKKADELNIPIEAARKIGELEEQQRQNEVYRRQESYRQHLRGLEEQARQLQQMYPSFNLYTELQNPQFRQWTSPQGGMSVEQAFFALHHDDMIHDAMSATAKKTAEHISSTIQAGQARPKESAAPATPATVTQFSPRNMSAAERQALRQQIHSAAARGVTLYPPDVSAPR